MGFTTIAIKGPITSGKSINVRESDVIFHLDVSVPGANDITEISTYFLATSFSFLLDDVNCNKPFRHEMTFV